MLTLPMRVLSSLWSFLASTLLGALLLMLLAAAMAAATVHETIRGTEAAMSAFYGAPWFVGLLALLGINLLGGLTGHRPGPGRRTTFVVTHASAIVILLGAAISWKWSIRGQVTLTEGTSTDRFTVEQELLRVDTEAAVIGEVALPANPSRARAVDLIAPGHPEDSRSRLSVVRRLADSRVVEHVLEDPVSGRPAIEVTLERQGESSSVWVFADEAESSGDLPLAYRRIDDERRMARLLGEQAAGPASAGMLRVEYEGQVLERAVEEFMAAAVPVGSSGRAVQVLRYLPHAVVDDNHQVTAGGDKPVNPAVEVEIQGPDGPARRWVFARFPDLDGMHGRAERPAVRVRFVSGPTTAPSVPIEVLQGPDRRFFARFLTGRQDVHVEPLAEGRLVPTPWPELRFGVSRALDRARLEQAVEEVTPPRPNPVPALELAVETPQGPRPVTVRKYVPEQVDIGSLHYRLAYTDRQVPLGFNLALRQFQVRNYPGSSRPRSFESRIAIADALRGDRPDVLIRMNHPARHGGYSLFQSGYGGGRDGQPFHSTLSVSWDPGRPVVFAGYLGMIAGMAIGLVRRLPRGSTASTEAASPADGRP